MSNFIDLSNEAQEMENAVEPKAVAGEFELEIKDFKTDDDGHFILKTKEAEKPYIMPILEVSDRHPESEYAKAINHYLSLPYDGMKKKDRNNTLFNLRSFCQCFGIDYSRQIDPEECIGKRGTVILGKSEDPVYGEKSNIKRFMVGK